MSDYLGRIITKNPTYPSPTAASGVWTLDEALQYQKAGKWPPGYAISRSVRLRSSASAYFNRTLSTPTSNTTWTLSCWLKRGALSNGGIFAESTGYAGIYFASDKIRVMDNAGSVALETTAVYRDPSAWAHLVVRSNGTNIKAYWNSVEVGSYTGTITLLNAATSHFIGRYSSNYFDGYLTEINFIDGQQLTPASFGYADTATGVWQPLPYTGTYGTNGFYLNFSDNSNNTATTLGKDYSGNGNNFTPNNISVTSGATYDSMVDSPSSYGTDTGVGGEVRGNYAVMNPLWKGSGAVIADGNLSNTPTTAVSAALTTMPVSSGKWYAEISHTVSNSSAVAMFFTSDNLSAPSFSIGSTTQTGLWEWYDNGSGVYVTSDGGAFGSSIRSSTFRNAGTFQFALDCDNGKFWFGKDNVWYDSTGGTTGNPSTGANATFTISTTRGPFNFGVGQNGGYVAMYLNAGQRAFSYTAPSGYKALNTQNLSVPTINNGANYMAATLYIGNGSTQTITNTVNGVSFAPDFAWVKVRSTAGTDHYLADTIRGATKYLQSDTTAAEGTNNGITAFNSNGFSVGAVGDTNTNGATIVGWNWKAGGTAVSNTSGSITSSVSASPTAGFSVVTWTGTGANATVGHGLGVAPSFIIARRRDNVVNWYCYHSSLAAGNILLLNTTQAQTSVPTAFNSGTPTSTTFPLGADTTTNASGGLQLAYCFAPIAGYSAFGSYTGNGSTDGPFVYLGFRPRFVMWKNASAAEAWLIEDTSRSTYNEVALELYPSSSGAEAAGSSRSPTQQFDYLSNGFKIRGAQTQTNGSGNTIIYAAFAENPFKYARAR